MSLKSPEKEPIKWYTFYSEKAKRDYFYEPKSGVVTWIQPDDLHPKPPQESPPQQSKEEKVVGRRVSFHESVEHPQSPGLARELIIGLDGEGSEKQGNDTGCRRMIVIFAILFICFVLATAFCTGWLSEERISRGVGLFSEKGAADNTSDTIWKAADLDTDATRVGVSEIASQQVKTTASNLGDAREAEHRDDQERDRDTETAQSGLKPIEDTSRKGQQQSTSSSREGTEQESLAEKNETSAQAPPEERRRQRKRDRQEGVDIEQEVNDQTRDKECRRPFAHLFSRKCRKILAKRPVYDMDAFLDSLI